MLLSLPPMHLQPDVFFGPMMSNVGAPLGDATAVGSGVEDGAPLPTGILAFIPSITAVFKSIRQSSS